MQLFSNPTIDRAQKQRLLESIFAPAGHSDLFKNFLLLLAENGRLNCFEAISCVYEEMMKAKANQLDIVLTSAYPLDKPTLQRLETLVRQKLLEPNQQATFSHRIDSGIMGGFIIEVGDKTVDLSIGSKGSQLQKEIAQR